MKLILDADVVIAALDGSDAQHPTARTLFTAWQAQDATRLISAVNLSEVLVAPAADQKRLRQAREAIAALGVTIHQPGEAIAVDAARLRHTHPISLPDAYCLATARHAGGSIATLDHKLIRAATAERIPLAATPTPTTPPS